jgi:transposase-like protein
MYSYDERLKAVKLLLQYDMSYSTVVRELGYPPKPLSGAGTTSICRREVFIGIMLSHRSLQKRIS